MKFCAICTSAFGPFVRRPLGRDDSMVDVCEGCDEEHPRQGRYSFGGGEVNARAPGTKRTRAGGGVD